MKNTAMNFEYFFRYELPRHLKLSPQKSVAMKSVFYHVADLYRFLESKNADAADEFFQALKERFEKVGKWRRPQGTVIAYTERDPRDRPIYKVSIRKRSSK